MRAIIAFLLFGTCIAHADAAQFTLSLTATIDGSPQTLTQSVTLPDAQMPYFWGAYQQTPCGSVPNAAVPSPSPAPTPPATTRAATQAETFSCFAAGLAQGVASNAQRYATQEAQQATAPTTITVSPAQ